MLKTVSTQLALASDTLSEILANGNTSGPYNIAMDSGYGIDFSATAGTGTSELLDDYEEGTWVPIPARLTGGAITTTGDITATGSYTKVGRQVTLVCEISITGTITQGSSNTVINGIPFLPITTPRLGPAAIGSHSALTTNPHDQGGVCADYAYTALTTKNANPWVAGIIELVCTYFTAA
jgi:hypothetical protein